jgi:nucleoside-diphosphate-sugar epimerase
MKVAVTGGTGCLGQPLLEKLIVEGFDIQLLALPQDPAIPILNEKVYVVTGNLNSHDALNALTKDCEIVFHLAGKIHSVPKTKAEEQDFYQVNVEGTKNLLRASTKNNVKRVVFYSTVGVYGQDADFHGDELTPCRPLSVYSKSKYLAEQLVLNSLNNGGPEGVVLRFPVVYGPLDRGNVAKLIVAIRRKLFFYFGDGKAVRSMISSTNAAEAALKAAFEHQAGNEVFCVTDGRDYTLNELVDCICRALGTSWRPYHVPVLLADLAGRFGDVLRKWAHVPFPIDSDRVRKLSRPLTFSCEKAKRVFAYKPTETLVEGICREVEWLKVTHGWK